MVTGLQQVSLTNNNKKSGENPTILCLIEPDPTCPGIGMFNHNSSISKERLERDKDNLTDKDFRDKYFYDYILPKNFDKTLFLKKIKQWLNKFTVADLFFTQLEHKFKGNFNDLNKTYDSSGGFNFSPYSSDNYGFNKNTEYEMLHQKRMSGIFDTTKTLPISIDLTTLDELIILEDNTINSNTSLKSIFNKQPSVLSNRIKDNQYSIFDYNNLSNWPVISSGYNVLTEPRIMTDFFAKMIELSCDLIGLRLIYTNRQEIDQQCVKPKDPNSYNTGKILPVRDIDSIVPAFAVCLRGTKMIKLQVKSKLGNVVQYFVNHNDSNDSKQLNVFYYGFLKEDKSFFHTPYNASKVWKTLAYFFGGRLKSIMNDGFILNFDKLETYPENHDNLIDNMRTYYKYIEDGEPEIIEPVMTDFINNNNLNTATARISTPTLELANAKDSSTSSKKKKKKNKSKKGKTENVEDIDALINDLNLDICQQPTNEETMFYSISISQPENILLVLSPCIESHLLPYILETCLFNGFRILNLNSCTLAMPDKFLPNLHNDNNPTKSNHCMERDVGHVFIHPNLLNISREYVTKFYPSLMDEKYKDLFGDEDNKEVIDLIEDEYESIGACRNMKSRPSHLILLNRENALAQSELLLSKLYSDTLIAVLDTTLRVPSGF